MEKLPRKSSIGLLGLFVLLFLTLDVAAAVEVVVYKQARPMRKIFQEERAPLKEFIIDGKKVDYYYDPAGKTDPFKSFIAKMEEVEEKRKRKPKTYLETLDLSQLELIAIIVGPRGNWAMVRESKGTGHVIKKGTPIGTNGGIVHKITDKEVVIREEYKDFRGQIKTKEVSKKVPSLR